MKKLAAIALISAALASPAYADRVGAVYGAAAGLLVGPPGIIIGAIIGGMFGSPWWYGYNPNQCWTDDNFVRHCPAYGGIKR